MPVEVLNNIETALLSAPTNWQKLAEQTLSNRGWTVHPISAQLHAWQPDTIKYAAPGFVCAESIMIGRIWLGANYAGNTLRIMPRRFYFRDGQLDTPLRDQEHELLSGRVAQRPNKIEVLEKVLKGKKALCAIDGFSEIETDPDLPEYNVFKKTVAVGGNGVDVPLGFDLWRGIAQAGAFKMPARMNLYVVNDPERPRGVDQTENYIRALEKKWQELGKGQGKLEVKCLRLDRLLNQLENVDAPAAIADSVFLLAVSGKKGDVLPETQSRVMEHLDAIGQEYRLFSYDNKNLMYSASNQMQSMIQSVGGLPYRLQLPFPENFEDGIMIGVDLGHDRDKRRSAAVAAALGPDGAFLGAVKQWLPLNEALKSSQVIRLLKAVFQDAEHYLGRSVGKVLIMRDGRVPARKQSSGQESVKDYISSLNVATSFIEVRKGGNPPLWQEKGSSIAPAVPGTIFSPQDGEIRLLTAYESIEQAGAPRTFKIAIPYGADTFNWGLDTYAALVCGLCYSASLGVKPHLPGPIYWADGFAKTSGKDNRFRGQNVRVIK